MKKIIITLCFSCMLAGLTVAQTRLKIGNMEMVFSKTANGNDTIMQISSSNSQASLTRNSDRTVKTKRRYHTSSWYVGLEFILPEDGDELKIYTGKSHQFNTGYRYCFHPTRWYGIGVIGQYSFYNYRLKNASEQLTGAPSDTYKEVFRSNNLGIGAFNRFYIFPGKRKRPNSNGMYVDAGVRGDWSYGRFYKMKSDVEDYSIKTKYRNSYAFYPFSASAFAAVGLKWFMITAQYRFTDVFNSKAVTASLPPISVGVQFSFD